METGSAFNDGKASKILAGLSSKKPRSVRVGGQKMRLSFIHHQPNKLNFVCPSQTKNAIDNYSATVQVIREKAVIPMDEIIDEEKEKKSRKKQSKRRKQTSQTQGGSVFVESPCVFQIESQTTANEHEQATPPSKRELIKKLYIMNKEKTLLIDHLCEINQNQKKTIIKLNDYLKQQFPHKFY